MIFFCSPTNQRDRSGVRIGSNLLFWREDWKVRFRRNLVVPARSGEGLLTILIADLRHRAVQPGGLLDAPPLSRNKARSAESNSDQSQQILLGACRA